MHVITFGIGILGAIFHLVSGITLTSLSDFMSTKGFSLVCDVQGTITTLVRVNDPLGNIAASCFPPPSSCGSGAGNTFIRNVPAGTFTVNVIQSNVDTTNSVGNWSCTDGSQVALFPVIEIVSVTEPKISTASNSAVDGSTVTVQIDCIYPYPDEIKIEYIKESDQTFLKRATAVTFVNGTASNCPVSDARAISVTGTLTVSREGLGEHAAKIKATLLLRGKEMISGLSDFIIASTCTGSFHCGFWLLLLAVVTSIIILILMWRKVKRFGFSASGFSKMKIGITGVFSFVAVGIGLGLGFGLQAGQANCLECGATIGISIALGVALSVIQFIVIINCDKEKGCDGNSKGTPASATGINLETKKKSQNKPTEKGTEASSLTAKTFGQPLPDTPNARKHQLEPLKTDSFEVENSTTEKKKKKKRKKKKETSEGNEASEEKEERPELEF